MAERWTLAVMGAWLIVSPWVLGFSDNFLAKWTNVLCGIVLVLIAAHALSEKWENEKTI
ncbi:MAG: SPW repeat protein [Minisyncoccia bacterium]|jgi:uncharacterized membrane protein